MLQPRPGLLLLFSRGTPQLRAIPLPAGRLVLGRDDVGGVPLDDDKVSRAHAEVGFESARWTIRDRESRNGTFVDGKQVEGELVSPTARIMRLGGTVFALCADVTPYIDAKVDVTLRYVSGLHLFTALAAVRQAAADGDHLLIHGASGTGRDLAAREYHEVRGGPYVTVSCATSGGTGDLGDRIEAAVGGTVYLDEIGELVAVAQAQVAKALERIKDVRAVASTQRDLRGAVSGGRFRGDLLAKLSKAHVELPGIRARIEEIPVLVAREVAKVDGALHAHAPFVESCLLRPWPGNVRELLEETRRAAHEARLAGLPEVRLEHLGPDAGTALADASTIPISNLMPSREELVAKLAANKGNVVATAQAMGVHRTQLYRWLEQTGLLDPA